MSSQEIEQSYKNISKGLISNSIDLIKIGRKDLAIINLKKAIEFIEVIE